MSGLRLVPPLACILDATARCRRRKLPLAPGLAAYGWRLTTWLVAAVALWLVHLLPGNVASGVAVPPLPGESGLSRLGIVIVAAVSFAYWWLVVRRRIAPRGSVAGVDRTVGREAGKAHADGGRRGRPARTRAGVGGARPGSGSRARRPTGSAGDGRFGV